MEELTLRQNEVLQFLEGYLTQHGYPPTMRDIAAHLRISGTLGVSKHLTVLERKGYIRRAPGNFRGISLVGHHEAKSASLPVVGVVRAGMLQPAIEDIEGYLTIDEAQLKGGKFFLRVKGDSMVNAAIIDGDLALIRPQPTAENHDIVVAMVDGEATLKAFYREQGQIRLQPRNPNMEPIIIREGEGEILIVDNFKNILHVRPFSGSRCILSEQRVKSRLLNTGTRSFQRAMRYFCTSIWSYPLSPFRPSPDSTFASIDEVSQERRTPLIEVGEDAVDVFLL